VLESTFYKVWSKRGGAKYTVEATLSGHSGIVYALAWDVGSQTLFSGSQDATVKVWSKRGRAKYTVEDTLSGHSGIVYALAWDMGSQTLFSGSRDDTIKCWGVGARPPQP
jgi:WD40 repeat protein